MAGKAPLDMQPYGKILGTHRRPNIPLDCLLHTDTSEHIIIIHNNRVRMYDFAVLSQRFLIHSGFLYFSRSSSSTFTMTLPMAEELLCLGTR